MTKAWPDMTESPFWPICDNRLADSPSTGRTIIVKPIPGQWSWDRPCDFCGAEYMKPCTTRKGETTTTHSARTNRKTAR